MTSKIVGPLQTNRWSFDSNGTSRLRVAAVKRLNAFAFALPWGESEGRYASIAP
ncbi:hypothetical protein Rleg10DRAFT_5147 [Rhizobium leguminosarum bv. trifolii WSM2012]|nr:hypothetical protein Rleg10DRAFT_3824 [Rhizobium leguminosarum bv. trifolii WSM2012]EJC76479.1 hypothetical protein Rleg10DRAFT_5147 [Rhizobium leguminosarum bv. trifolii WSM2012]